MNAATAPILASCRARFLAMLQDAVAATGLRSPALQKALSEGAGQAFDELAGLHNEAEFKRLRSVTASRISLVHPEDMDLTVELINLAHDLADACERELPRLHLLFMRLLGQDNSVLDQLPVGPDAVCAALRALCDEGELTGELRLDVPDRLKPTLVPILRQFYTELTTELEAAGVTPQSLLRHDNAPVYRGYPLPENTPADGGYEGPRQASLATAHVPDIQAA